MDDIQQHLAFDLTVQEPDSSAVQATARIQLHFPVKPGATLLWHAPADAHLLVRDAPLWLVRNLDPYDYWLTPGSSIAFQAAERLRLVNDSEHAAMVSFILANDNRIGFVARLRLLLTCLMFDLSGRSSRW